MYLISLFEMLPVVILPAATVTGYRIGFVCCHYAWRRLDRGALQHTNIPCILHQSYSLAISSDQQRARFWILYFFLALQPLFFPSGAKKLEPVPKLFILLYTGYYVCRLMKEL